MYILKIRLVLSTVSSRSRILTPKLPHLATPISFHVTKRFDMRSQMKKNNHEASVDIISNINRQNLTSTRSQKLAFLPYKPYFTLFKFYKYTTDLYQVRSFIPWLVVEFLLSTNKNILFITIHIFEFRRFSKQNIPSQHHSDTYHGAVTRSF